MAERKKKTSKSGAPGTESATKSGTGSAESAPPFEECVRQLEQIVEQLEGGQLPLEKSLELFEHGVQLARKAQTTLSTAERRVEELLSVDESGEPIVKELEGE